MKIAYEDLLIEAANRSMQVQDMNDYEVMEALQDSIYDIVGNAGCHACV